jgi:[ribosomal protein S18]-alanine N-acetyltransferase
MKLRAADASDAVALAKAHASGFESPWPPEAFVELLNSPGVFALAAVDKAPVGLILMRAIAGEAEVLTLAVEPSHRRRGVARALLAAGLAQAIAAGAEEAFLEVAADNPGALQLYRQAGFTEAGHRGGYYQRPGGLAVDALVLRRTINGASNP